MWTPSSIKTLNCTGPEELVTFCSEQAAVEDNYGGEAGEKDLGLRYVSSEKKLFP